MIRILGIDPGSVNTGYGVIDTEGDHSIHIASGIIKMTQTELAEKLHYIQLRITDLIDQHRPREVSVEKVFMHKNADSALKLGQARGAAIAACMTHDVELFEYTANQVKQATVGKGHAAKQQVQHMVRILLCLAEAPVADAADALAVALCHAHSRTGPLRIRGVQGMRKGRLQ